MKSWKRDLILSVCMLLFVGAATVYAIIMKSPRINIFLARPDTYMALWLILLGVLSVMLMIRALKKRAAENVILPKIWVMLGIFTVIVLVVYLLIMKQIGFLLSSALMLWSLTVVYSLNIGAVKKDYRDFKGVMLPLLIKSAVFSFVSSFITTRIFTDLLSANLPTFSLF